MNLSIRTLPLALLCLSATAQGQIPPPRQAGQPVGFEEVFALAEDRGAVLEQLLPGSSQHYFYSCLHLQQTGALDRADELISRWREEGATPALRQIEARQALLRASDDPARTFKFLEDELGLKFNHRRESSDAVTALPQAFDQEAVGAAALIKAALNRKDGRSVNELSPAVRRTLLTGTTLTKAQRGAVLDQLEWPDVPGLVAAIEADLREHPKATFGSRAIHKRLLLDQLEELRRRRPALLSNRLYVESVLRRLAPVDGASMGDRAVREAYLDRALAFADQLPEAFNSVKVHLLYHRLVLDLDAGQVNRERFMRYLRLPRQVGYLDLDPQARAAAAGLGDVVGGATRLPAVGTDEPVVQELLETLLRGQAGYQDYLAVLPERFVRRAWARTQLLYGGEGDQDGLIEMLGGPAEAEALRNMVELEFERTNPRSFEADEAVSLSVRLKNVDSLLIKVFRVDPVAYFDLFNGSIATNINLDGLVTNDQFTVDLDAPPMRRVERLIDLPAVDEPGTYVVELIGGGVASRAIVRKGRLDLIERVGPNGHVFAVFDGERMQVMDAVLRFGERDFTANAQGYIRIPFTTEEQDRRVLVRSGALSEVSTFRHRPEAYSLDGATHIAAEALIEGNRARIIVRPRLTLNGQRLSLDRVEDLQLEIESWDFEQAISTLTVEDLRAASAALLESDGEGAASQGILVAEIQVPERLRQLRVQLKGKVRRSVDGERVELSSSQRNIAVNGMARTATVGQAMLRRDPGAFKIELRGRNGEALAGRAARVSVWTRYSSRSITKELRSNELGHLDLGALQGATRIRVTGEGIGTNDWSLPDREVSGLAGELNTTVGRALRVPFEMADGLEPSDVSLVELRAEHPVADRFSALSLEPGYLVLKGLERGSYALRIRRSGESFRVQVEEGEVRAGFVLSQHRALPLSSDAPLTIRQVQSTGDGLTVELAGVSAGTQVAVLGSRYQGHQDPAEELALGHVSGRSPRTLVSPATTYDSGRAIGEEYRYILSRRAQEIYPGNMLARASILLNPWVLSETTDRMESAFEVTNELIGLGGGAGGKFGGRLGGRARKQKRERVESLDLNFLARPAVILAGLTPDAQGRVRIPAGAFDGLQQFRIVAFDGAVATSREVLRTPRPIALRDERLADGLDPARPMTQQRQIKVLEAGDTLVIRDGPNADAQTFQTLGDVFRLYATMTAGAPGRSALEPFEFLTRWPALDGDEKRALYSEFACHEVNVFIHEKDPVFFREVVGPYLANKGARTFMDDWLLGEDLAGYLEPWRYQRLNAVERILLLRRLNLDADRSAQDLLATVPAGVFSLDRVFSSVLASRSMDRRRSLLDTKLAEVRKQAAPTQSAAPAPPRGGGGGGGGPASPGPSGPSSPAPTAPALAQDSLRELGYGGGGESGSDDFFLGRGVADRPVERGREQQQTESMAGEVNEEFEVFAGVEGLWFADEGLDSSRALYRGLDPTQAFAETHYWRVRRESMTYGLVPISPFWADFAAAEGPFFSTHFPTATRSATEALLALAFLDLPFSAEESEVELDGRSVRLTVGSPALVALEDIAPSAADPGQQQRILVGQDFFELSRPTEKVDGVDRDRFITGEFLVGVPYGCRMVLSNTSSAPVELVALVQIPEGALPVNGDRVTNGELVTLPAYGTQSLEVAFYFPSPGDFQDYPIHAGRGEVLLGAAPARTLAVVEELSEVDRSTWDWISQNGSVEDVVAYLEAGNPRTVDLSRIAWRMGDQGAFEAITASLTARQVSAPVLDQYAIKLRDEAGTRRFLSTNGRILGLVQAPFQSPLYTVSALDRGLYEHLAFEPLVRGRSHEAGSERRILNDEFAAQYRRFLRRISLGTVMTGSDRMELAYYLLLQNRIGEALAAFDGVQPDGVEMALQYDYMSAYMDFYRGDTAHAREVASRHVDHPVDRWSERFRGVIAQLDEIESGKVGDADLGDSRDAAQNALAATEPILEFEIDGSLLKISHERVGDIELRYHLMDVEFLFSANPFVRGEVGQSSLIEPNRVEVVSLDGASLSTSIPLPEDLERSNLFVEVRGAGITRRGTYFSSRLTVQGLERYGQLRVVDSEGLGPISKAYVKVYGMAGGEVRFIKDGYTDLRGRFDYASVSGYEGPPVSRYSVLVLHEEAGATITELSPPIR